jgi:trehalose synthase
VGGIPLQVQNGLSGYLVSSVEECAARALDVLSDPSLGRALGRRGKEHVRAHFLTPRYLRDYLVVLHDVLELEADVEPAEPAAA